MFLPCSPLNENQAKALLEVGGRLVRAAGVTEEDRKALLGHKNGSITSHYSAAELDQLIDAANRVSVTDSRAPALTILKRRQG